MRTRRLWPTTDPVSVGFADARFVNVTGDTMGGALLLQRTPLVSLEAATKGYVDAAITGAPTDAAYLVLATNPTLTAERQLQTDATLTLTDLGVNSTGLLRLNTLTTVVWEALQTMGSGLLVGGSALHVAPDSVKWVKADAGWTTSLLSAAVTSDSAGSAQISFTGAGSANLTFNVVPILQEGGAPDIVRDLTFYFNLVSGTRVTFNRWYEVNKTNDAVAVFDDDTTAISTGTAHTASGTPVTLSQTGALLASFRVEKTTAGAGTVTFRSIKVTWDTN